MVEIGTIISKNFKVGYPIDCVEDIDSIAQDRRSVYIECWRKLLPASVIINYQAKILVNFIKENLIYNIERI